MLAPRALAKGARMCGRRLPRRLARELLVARASRSYDHHGMSSSAPPAHHITLDPGTRLDRYELLCVLAHGGMANVWLARVQGKMGFERLFAVKTILPTVADDPSFKSMFLDEARIASRIEHPNVVHMVDVGECSGVPYLVMDLVEGEPLQKLPRACEKLGQRIPVGVLLRILADACHGLHAAHELRDESGALLDVVHRDMSPQNILLSSSGVAKVIDFGVAKARDRSTNQTSAGTLKGKVSYMPREQALGQHVDRRSDIWALGAVLYYLLAGRPPYKEAEQLATLQLAMSGAPIPPLPPTLPMSLRAAVAKALAHDPAQRFQTAAEMGEALELMMRKLGVVTTHADVGAFVQRTLGEKLVARKKLVVNALAEAGNRSRVRSELMIPVDLDVGEGSHSHDGKLVALPTDILQNAAVLSVNGMAPAGRAPDAAPDASTRGAFSAPVAGAPGKPPPWLVLGAVGGAAAGGLGVLMIVLSLRARSAHQVRPAEGTAVPPPATSTIGASEGHTRAASDAGAAAGPSAAPRSAAESAAAAADVASPTGAASGSTPATAVSENVRASSPPVAAASALAAPVVSTPTSPKRTPRAKRRDDEAGF